MPTIPKFNTQNITFKRGSAPSATTDKMYNVGGILYFGGASIRGNSAIATKTYSDSPYTLTSSDYTILCDCSSGAITINLPAANTCSGKIYNIKKIDSSVNTVTIDGDGSETIDDELTQTIVNQNTILTLQSDGSNWSII